MNNEILEMLNVLAMTITGIIVSTILIVTGIIFVHSSVAMLNPEYCAIQEILTVLK